MQSLPLAARTVSCVFSKRALSLSRFRLHTPVAICARPCQASPGQGPLGPDALGHVPPAPAQGSPPAAHPQAAASFVSSRLLSQQRRGPQAALTMVQQSSATTDQKLVDLRKAMQEADGGQGVDAFVVPSEDPHMVTAEAGSLAAGRRSARRRARVAPRRARSSCPPQSHPARCRASTPPPAPRAGSGSQVSTARRALRS
jgi:hypothetical protein